MVSKVFKDLLVKEAKVLLVHKVRKVLKVRWVLEVRRVELLTLRVVEPRP
jgi:hypothetical protein